MKKRKLCAIALAVISASTAVHAGHMQTGKLLFIEAGGSYTHAFYKSSVTTVEGEEAGFGSFNPRDFFPNNFWGGYIGLSWYQSDWLFNSRYDMFEQKTKTNTAAAIDTQFAPVKLSFTLDKVWGCIDEFTWGLGGGVVVDNINKGEVDDTTAGDAFSETVHDTRIDPVVEAFAMYRFANSVGLKLNVGYQIPVHSKMGRGDLNVNLGINYAIPV